MQRGQVLSIQSWVAYGHVGNAAAMFPLQRLGFETIGIPTVVFSNHTGYGAWRGHHLEVAEVRAILQGVEERGALAACDAVLSGYLGDASLGAAVLDAVAKVREARPGAIYACDPVMGDEGRGMFVREGIPAFFRDHAVPAADIVTPNQFELAWLARRPIGSIADAAEAAEAVRRTGPKLVVCTSLTIGPEGQLGILGHTAEGSWIVWTPRLDIDLNGTGDAFTALLLGAWLNHGDPKRALEDAVSAMFALVETTHRLGRRELALVAAQEALVSPPRRFEAVTL